MSTPKKAKRPPTRKAQKAIITITEEADGKVGVEMTFKPSVKGDAEMTPCLELAVRAMKFIAEQGSKE